MSITSGYTVPPKKTRAIAADTVTTYEILPYRFIPLLVFFSIGVWMFFSKKLVKLP